LNRFLIINPFGIGDVLFTTPVIRSVKETFPDARIGYWCNERVEGILKNNIFIDKVFALSRGDLKKIYSQSKLKGIYRFLSLLSSIRKERFDISLDFSLDHRYSLISKILGIKKRIGFNYKKRGLFLTDKIGLEGYNAKHVVEYYLGLLKFLEIKPRVNNLDLFVSEKNKLRSKGILTRYAINDKDLIIGIAPGAGASWGRDASFKHWSAIKFAQLADKLIAAFGAKILILGDESERPIADIIVNAARNRVVDLSGKATLEEAAGLISNLRILITNDGGPLHMAVASGVETVSIFGPVDEKVYGPYPAGREHIVIKKELACRPCYRNFRFGGCLYNRSCIDEITVQEVFAAVEQLMQA
jgi:lipopolysaccharide heptosyltransferase II